METNDKILETLEWFKQNLPDFVKHNSSSQETKDGFRDLGEKIDKKMDKSTFFSLIGTVIGIGIIIIGAQWAILNNKFDDLKDYIKEEISDVEKDVSLNTQNITSLIKLQSNK